MKTSQLLSGTLVLFLITVLQARAQSADAIVGLWYNTEKTAKIDIQKTGSIYSGEIVWLKNPNPDGKPATDKNNEDHTLRKRPLVGLKLLDGLTYAKGIWKDGEIYDPNSGKTYSCELKLQSKEVLEVKGYLGFSFVGKTVEWTRIE
ncbi:DUF2147 domain-containing protein [Algoriphagus aestuariicola]|jgi:uncharacterized protein (DUF2147 family)|uniref:DUF2147 domain-containing protein n=1 Tax=Algoriphagus aestuariicola TaxID=1852016 RepID=A0ABS3BSP4_9BACT|nr:DUF2147 domain-containing protein [Algoriphagus aestuariicola]MBN7800699.1 DUF2147 domain-containing protein [Algoriphagus aestuariicola]